jgi:Na+/H+-dicarboxylate symporter
MNPNLSTLGPLAAVVVSWAAIWWLRRRGLNFSLIAILALAVGIPIGLLAGEHLDAIKPIGHIYINVLLATVAPLILVSIVSAITSLGSLAKLRTIGLRSVSWLMLSNALAVVVALGIGLALQPGSGVDRVLGSDSTDTIQGQVQKFGDVVVGFFPTNVVENFGANDIIPIILIAVTLAVAYLALAEREPEKVRPFAAGAEALKLVIFKAVGYVIRLTPYAIVALTADMVGSSTDLGGDFTSLVGLLALVWVACFLHAYVLNGALLAAFARVPVAAFFRKIFPAQVIAFSTQSSVGSLPVTTRQLTHEVGVHPEVAHFTAPLGTTIGMPGCAGIWPILIAVWGINAYGLQYSVGDYALLAVLGIVVSVGVAGVPGAATVSAATVLSAAGLPLEFVAATIPIGVIADMARTSTNVTAAAVSATIVARQTHLLDDEIFAGRATYVEPEVPSVAPALPAASGVPAVAAPSAAPAAAVPLVAPSTGASAAPATADTAPFPAVAPDPWATTPAHRDLPVPTGAPVSVWAASPVGDEPVPRVFWGTTELSPTDVPAPEPADRRPSLI